MKDRKTVMQERLLREAIKGLVAEERVDRLLETVVLDDDDIYALEEGRWDGLKQKLAAAGLALACTATGCAPVVSATGQPVDPTTMQDEYGFNMDDLKPGESGVDIDDTGSAGNTRDAGHENEVPATRLGGSLKVNRAGGLGGGRLR